MERKEFFKLISEFMFKSNDPSRIYRLGQMTLKDFEELYELLCENWNS